MSSQRLSGCAFVVVLYCTDALSHLAKAKELVEDGAIGFFIDNTPTPNIEAWPDESILCDDLYHIRLHKNMGIAHALNVGVKASLARECKYIFTFDQDSEMTSDLLVRLLATYREFEDTKGKFFALGPHPINRVTGASYLRRRDRIRAYVIGALKGPRVLKTAEIITSGLLANRETYELVGPYDENLFIDFVDHEWCWRLSRMGGECGVDLSVPLLHMVGRGDVPYTFGMKLGAPGRLYFLFRNAITLMLRGRMPLFDALKFLVLIPVKVAVFSLMPDRCARLKEIGRGIVDGLKLSMSSLPKS